MRSIRLTGLIAGAFALAVFSAESALGQSSPPTPVEIKPAGSQPSSKPEKLLRKLPPGETIPIQEAPKAAVSGPMRAEVLAILDYRVRVIGEVPGGAPKPTFRVIMKVTGERLYEVFRIGKLIVDDLSDDTGTKFIDPSAYSEADRTEMQPLANVQAVTSQGYIMLDANPVANPGTSPGESAIKTPARSAKSLNVRGFVNVALGSEEANVDIDGAARKPGELLSHAKLDQLGIKVRVLKLGDEANEAADGKGIALRFEAGEDMVKNIEFYDDWMKKIGTRPRPGTAKDGKPYTYYSIGNVGPINDDWQLTLTVFGKVEKMKLELDAKNVELP